MHTQGIESTWDATERLIRKKGVMGTSNSPFLTYLQKQAGTMITNFKNKITAATDSICHTSAVGTG